MSERGERAGHVLAAMSALAIALAVVAALFAAGATLASQRTTEKLAESIAAVSRQNQESLQDAKKRQAELLVVVKAVEAQNASDASHLTEFRNDVKNLAAALAALHQHQVGRTDPALALLERQVEAICAKTGAACPK